MAALAQPPRVAKASPKVLAPAELAQVLLAVADPTVRRLALLAAHTGLRQGELLGLRWQDVDLATGELHVTQALQRIGGR